jgi:hypothetical protein
MSDTNLTDKFSESILAAIKKANIFEKTNELKGLFKSFVVITSLLGITTLVNGIYNTYLIKNNYKEQRKNKINLKKSVVDNIYEDLNYIYFCQKLILLESKIDTLYKKLVHEDFEKNKSENVIKCNEITEENELLNECYDNIPCNNSKKIIGLNKFLNWI